MSTKPNDLEDYCDLEMKKIKFEVITAKVDYPLSRGCTYNDRNSKLLLPIPTQRKPISTLSLV